jgi:hypothetical protein
MATEEPPTNADPVTVAQRTADRLALALEDVGFDVGRAFPALNGGVDRERLPVVDLGRVGEPVALQLATVLERAAGSRCASGEHRS